MIHIDGVSKETRLLIIDLSIMMKAVKENIFKLD